MYYHTCRYGFRRLGGNQPIDVSPRRTPIKLHVFSERVPGLIWFGYVYLVTTAGFVADQLT